MIIQYEYTNMRPKTLAIIQDANQIIAEYQEQGFELTVRQIYYQFVARDLLPEEWTDLKTGSKNNLKSYTKLTILLGKARLGGLMDWEAIVDRTRIIYKNSHWDSPWEILESAAQSYKLDTRENQEYYIEVWIEKNALLGVIEPICKKLDITYLPCIGYYSLSSMWRAAGRFISKNKPCIILHLGDHDPSGIDMTRDIRDRLVTFNVKKLKVIRIALNIDQVKEYNPPSNPVKLTDSRKDDYISKYGMESWELDALSPNVIAELIKKRVNHFTDFRKLQVMIEGGKKTRFKKGQAPHNKGKTKDNYEPTRIT
ncbi:hypothetical protein LCGC14_2787280, partial [marine sediment metagenome]